MFGQARAGRLDEEQQSEQEIIQGKLAHAQAAMDRYFRAFDTATMPEGTCAPRITVLAGQAKSTLSPSQRDRRRPTRAPTQTDLDALRSTLHIALKDSIPSHAPRAIL